jgi:uncharacterized protein YbaR (Trm112 family)
VTIIIEGGTSAAEASARTGLNLDLFDLLVCPVDKHDLRLEDNTLRCDQCGRGYPIEDGIPNMLVEDSSP